MRPQLILHFAGAGTICRGIVHPGTAAKASQDVAAGRTEVASQIGYAAVQRSDQRRHPEVIDSILDLLAVAL